MKKIALKPDRLNDLVYYSVNYFSKLLFWFDDLQKYLSKSSAYHERYFIKIGADGVEDLYSRLIVSITTVTGILNSLLLQNTPELLRQYELELKNFISSKLF